MKWISFGFLLLLTLALGVWLWDGSRSKDSTETAAIENKASEQSSNAPSPQKEDALHQKSLNAKTLSSDTKDVWVEKMRNADLSQDDVFDAFISALKDEDGPELGQAFVHALDQFASDAVMRDKLVLTADSLESSHNLAFWKKLAQRDPPPPAGDPKEYSAEPSPIRLRADLETRTAMRNIRLLASQNAEAKDLLKELAETKVEGLVQNSVKELALNFLAEIDLPEAARIRKLEAQGK